MCLTVTAIFSFPFLLVGEGESRSAVLDPTWCSNQALLRVRAVQLSWCVQLPQRKRWGREDSSSAEERSSSWWHFLQEASQYKRFSWAAVTTLRALAAGLGGGFLPMGAHSSAELPWAKCCMKRCHQPRGERRKHATRSNYRHHFISFEGGNEGPGAHLLSSWLYRTLFSLLVLSSTLSVVTVTFKDKHCQLFISISGWPGIITSWQGCLTLWVPAEGYVFAKW